MSRLLEFLADLLLGIYFAIVDAIAGFLPSTPEQFKLGSILTAFLAEYTFMDYFVIQIGLGVLGILAIALVYKVVKILPFT